MRELSLFTGSGGGILGTKLLGWKTVGYVEFNEYCQKVLAARIKDGYIENAPIFGDVRAFISEGYAAAYKGLVDVVSGGFPCQPFSTAGFQAAEDDPRNMWPATLRVIEEIQPAWAFLENVTGLLQATHGYFGTILADLASIGYNARWGVLSAEASGAPHVRERLWLIAYKKKENVANSRKNDAQFSKLGKDTDREHTNAKVGANVQSNTMGESFNYREQSWWETEPRMGRVVDGVANGVDRLEALGNGQVPIVAASAWSKLITE